jgi:quinol monooxygenase YgiN
MTQLKFQLEKEESMATQDKCCTIVPHFKVHADKLDQFKAVCQKFVKKAETEKGCLYYGYSFDGNDAHCREGYSNAAGLLAHLDNIGSMLPELLKLSELTRLEVHGPAEELSKLKGPLADFKPQYFTLEYGFRRDQ